MKKIRRFAVVENAILLTAEQMRQIGGGAQSCNTGSCTATLYWSDGRVEDLSGTCSSKTENGNLICYCNTAQGAYGYDVANKNECIAS
jgi:hypothetical protein